MAENKLFYNVSESNANAFKDIKKDEKVLGLVHSGLDGDFGYFISQGKQFGASKTEINSMISTGINNFAATLDETYATDDDLSTVTDDLATVSGQVDTMVNSSAAFAVGTEKFKILFDEESRISVVKYTSITNFTCSLGSATNAFTTTHTGDGTYYVGTTYSGSASIVPSSTFDSHKISMSFSCTNPTSETFTYEFSSTNTTISGALKGCVSGESSGTTSGAAYVLAGDVFNKTTNSQQYSGTVVWGNTYSDTLYAPKKTTNALTIAYFAQEKVSEFLPNPTAKSGNVTIGTPSVTFKVTPKLRIGIVVSANEITDSVYDINGADGKPVAGTASTTTLTTKWAMDQSTLSNIVVYCNIPANHILHIFIPQNGTTALFKDPTIHENNVAETQLSGFFNAAKTETKECTINGCKMTYKVLKAYTAGGAREVRVKINKK